MGTATARTTPENNAMMNTSSPSFNGIHRAAVDQTVAKVFAKGVKHQEMTNFGNCLHWQNPPPFTTRLKENQPQIIGHKCGRLTVIGLSTVVKGSWVVRCLCGDYETRRHKALMNQNNWGDRCMVCQKKASAIVRHEWVAHGREVDVRSI
jgi:hypothetical protein